MDSHEGKEQQESPAAHKLMEHGDMVVSRHIDCTDVIAEDGEMVRAGPQQGLGTEPLLSASPLASPYSRLIFFFSRSPFSSQQQPSMLVFPYPPGTTLLVKAVPGWEEGRDPVPSNNAPCRSQQARRWGERKTLTH